MRQRKRKNLRLTPLRSRVIYRIVWLDETRYRAWPVRLHQVVFDPDYSLAGKPPGSQTAGDERRRCKALVSSVPEGNLYLCLLDALSLHKPAEGEEVTD